ncbi:MAG: hypothetical protein K0S27_1149 [Gammaproteobacteria bacterium]|jgi:hypothetical protein|nr:hypothetical protein [Gammaproteobacteria bacterium]
MPQPTDEFKLEKQSIQIANSQQEWNRLSLSEKLQSLPSSAEEGHAPLIIFKESGKLYCRGQLSLPLSQCIRSLLQEQSEGESSTIQEIQVAKEAVCDPWEEEVVSPFVKIMNAALCQKEFLVAQLIFEDQSAGMGQDALDHLVFDKHGFFCFFEFLAYVCHEYDYCRFVESDDLNTQQKKDQWDAYLAFLRSYSECQDSFSLFNMIKSYIDVIKEVSELDRKKEVDNLGVQYEKINKFFGGKNAQDIAALLEFLKEFTRPEKKWSKEELSACEIRFESVHEKIALTEEHTPEQQASLRFLQVLKRNIFIRCKQELLPGYQPVSQKESSLENAKKLWAGHSIVAHVEEAMMLQPALKRKELSAVIHYVYGVPCKIMKFEKTKYELNFGRDGDAVGRHLQNYGFFDASEPHFLRIGAEQLLRLSAYIKALAYEKICAEWKSKEACLKILYDNEEIPPRAKKHIKKIADSFLSHAMGGGSLSLKIKPEDMKQLQHDLENLPLSLELKVTLAALIVTVGILLILSTGGAGLALVSTAGKVATSTKIVAGVASCELIPLMFFGYHYAKDKNQIKAALREDGQGQKWAPSLLSS